MKKVECSQEKLQEAIAEFDVNIGLKRAVRRLEQLRVEFLELAILGGKDGNYVSEDALSHSFLLQSITVTIEKVSGMGEYE